MASILKWSKIDKSLLPHLDKTLSTILLAVYKFLRGNLFEQIILRLFGQSQTFCIGTFLLSSRTSLPTILPNPFSFIIQPLFCYTMIHPQSGCQQPQRDVHACKLSASTSFSCNASPRIILMPIIMPFHFCNGLARCPNKLPRSSLMPTPTKVGWSDANTCSKLYWISCHSM